MSIIDGLRSQFPMYDDLSDAELLEGYRNKFHPDTSLQELEELYADKIEREERERQLENQGFFGRAADLIEAGGREFVGASAEGIATVADMIGGDRTDSFEQSLQSFAEGQREEARSIPGIQPILEAEGIGDVVSSGASYLAQSIPELAAVSAAFYAGGKGGAAVGTAIAPGPGTALGALIGSIGAGTAAGLLAFAGRNVEEFKRVQGRDPTFDEQQSILGTAAVQSAANTLLSKLLFAKGTGRTITGNMVKKGLQGTGAEALTETIQEALTIGQANNYEDIAELISNPENQRRLGESFLAGGLVGGGIGTASGVFGVEPTPDPDKDLKAAAEEFVAGRPQDPEAISGPPPVPQLESFIMGGKRTDPTGPEIQPPRPQRVEPVVDREGNVQQQVLTGQQEPLLQARPDTRLTPDERARQINQDMVMDITRRAIENGQDPLVALSDPAIEQDIIKNIQLEQESDAVIAPTPVSQADQNVSRLNNRQLIEFAEQNADSDPILAEIMAKEIPIPAKTRLIRRRLAEKNISPTTSLEQDQQVGDPILRKTSAVDEDGKIRLTATPDTVQETDIATQPRMVRRTDTAEGKKLRQEIGPIVTRGLLDALKIRGGEASTRFTPDGLMDEDATSRAETRYQGATNYLLTRLDAMAKRGDQGAKAANAIKTQVLNNKKITSNEIVGAFLAADAIVDTLGGQGAQNGVDIRFFDRLTQRNDAYGFKLYEDTVEGKSKAVIELALQGDTVEGIRGTAAHEAFHVLQDFYASESPKDKKVLDSFYKLDKDGKVNYKALPASIKRLWKKHGREGYHDLALKGQLPDQIAKSPSEFQAMTYEYYKKAQAAGEANPLSGPMGGYFNFVSQFLPRLKNSLNGMGFQTAQDVFARAGKGKTGQQLKGRKLTPREPAPFRQAAEEASERNIMEEYKKQVSSTGMKPDPTQAGTVIEGSIEYEMEAGPVTSVETKSPLKEGVNFLRTLLSSDLSDIPELRGKIPQSLIDAAKGESMADFRTALLNHPSRYIFDQTNDDRVIEKFGNHGLIIGDVERNRTSPEMDEDVTFTLVRMSGDGKNNIRVATMRSTKADAMETNQYLGTDSEPSTVYLPYSTETRQLNQQLIDEAQISKSVRKIKRNVMVLAGINTVYSNDLYEASTLIDEDSAIRIGQEGGTVRLLNIDFRVDDSFAADENFRTPINLSGMSKLYGAVLAGVRKALDAQKKRGERIDGIMFAGNESKRDETRSTEGLFGANQKQRIYNRIARMKSFAKEFPELSMETISGFGSTVMPTNKIRQAKSDLQNRAQQRIEQQLALFNDDATTVDADFDVVDSEALEAILGEASMRFERVPDLSQVTPNRANNQVANTLGLTDRERALSSLDVLYNPDFSVTVPERDIGGPGPDGFERTAGSNINEVARALQNRALSIIGQAITKSNPETDEMLAKIMAAETVAAMQNNPDTNAANWYTENIKRAIASVSKLYPEIATNREHRSAFSVALAITSQGIKVDRNSAIGLGAYEFWRKNGRFPEFGEGEAAGAMRANFKTANKLMKAFNARGRNFRFVDFLDSQYTKRELMETLEQAGIDLKGPDSVSLSGENMDAKLYGSFVFGPKIGQGFYQNLMGNYDPVTIDKWFMRTWGRLTGTLIGKPAYKDNIAALRTMMLEEGIEFDQELFGTDEQYTLNKVSEVYKMGEDFYKQNREEIDAKRMAKSPAMKKAKNAYDNGMKPNEALNGTKRQWMRSVVARAREILAQQGINVTSADLQAILWYPEKDLYDKLGNDGSGADRLNQSYEDSFGELIDGETGIRTVDGRGRFDSVRESIRQEDRQSRRGTGGTSGQEASIRLGRDYRTTEGMKRVLADPARDNVGRKFFNVLRPFTTKEGRKQQFNRFIDSAVHGLRPIGDRERRLSAVKYGVKRYLPFAEGAFKIAEFAQQRSGRMQQFIEHGPPVLGAEGEVTIDNSIGGLREIFSPIGTGPKYAQFQMYVYAKRAQRLKAEGRENLMSDADIQEGLSYGAQNPEFDRVYRNYNAFNEKVMQFMVDTGAIDLETKRKLTGTADYIPFYRIIDDEMYTEGFFGQLKTAKQGTYGTTSAFDNPEAQIKSAINKLKGGEEQIGDLYENVYKNINALVNAGYQNLATQRIVKLTEEMKRYGLYDEVDQPRHLTSSEATNNNNHLTYRENGKTRFYDVGSDGELLQAMRSFTPIQMQGIFAGMQDIGRFFRSAITMTPPFMAANFLRGDMAGYVTVDAPIRPIVDSAIGLKNALKDTETVQEMKTLAGFGGYTFGDNKDFSKKMKRFYRRHQGYEIIDSDKKLEAMMQFALDKGADLIDAVNTGGEATENATREGIYRRLRDSGMSKADAAYEALNLINYSRKGNPNDALGLTIATLVPLVPFLNARLQGLYRTGTAFGVEADAKSTIRKGLGMFALSMAYYAAASSHDEWDQEPLHRKLNYYIFYIGDKKFLLPKPFEIGAIFSTIPELIIDGIRKKDGQLVADGVTQTLLNTFSFNPIPQAVRPIIEVAANYDFFRGRELESMGVRGLPTKQRAYSNTSEFAKMVGNISQYVGISPIEVEQLINGYIGSMGQYVYAGMDAILGAFGAIPSKPSGVFGDSVPADFAKVLGLSRFVKPQGTDPANQYMTDFYELKREADEVVRGINRLREEGNYEEARDMRSDNRGLISVRSTLNKMYQQLNNISDRISGVRASGDDPDTKQKRIDQLIRQRNRVVKRMVKIKERIRRLQ